MRVLFIAGKKRSGKDTFALFVKDKFENKQWNVKILHFADLLKQDICELFDIKLNDLERLKNNETLISPICGISFRQLLQRYADKMKELDEEYWSKRLYNKIDKTCDVLIIADYRYSYESRVFEDYECEFVKVKKDILNRDKHSSETEFDNVAFPYEMKNNGDLYMLEKQAEMLTNDLEKKWLGEL